MDKLLINATKAAELLDIKKSFFYELHSSGRLGPMPVKLGRKTLWRVDELKRWTQAGCPARTKWLKDGDNGKHS